MVEGVERIVLTGGPSCGKTSVLRLLDKTSNFFGYRVLHESARPILDSIENPERKVWGMKDLENLESAIYFLQRQKEAFCEGRVFQDRSQLDNLAYTRDALGYIPDYMAFPHHRYDTVFLFDLLPFEADGTRIESNEAEQIRKHEFVKQMYLEQGYQPIIVPVLEGRDKEESIRRRTRFILEKVGPYWP